jgi:hypothetical protein
MQISIVLNDREGNFGKFSVILQLFYPVRKKTLLFKAC